MIPHFYVDPDSVAQISNYLQQTQAELIGAAKEGMADAMVSLGAAESTAAPKRSGSFAEVLRDETYVRTAADFIRGFVRTTEDRKNTGLWIERGVRAVDKSILLMFLGVDGKPVFTQGRAAIAAKPFLDRTLFSHESRILEIILGKVNDKLGGDGGYYGA